MSSKDKILDDTLQNMITNLKPIIEMKAKPFEDDTLLAKSFNLSGSFEHTPTKKRKFNESNNSLDYISSPREIRLLKADLLEAKNTILSLNSRIQQMHSLRKEMEIMFDRERQSFEKNHKHDYKTIEKLEIQIEAIRKRENKLKIELSEMHNQYHVLKQNTNKRIEELEKCFNELKEKSESDSNQKDEAILNLNQKITELEVVLHAAEEDAEAQKKLSKELETRLSEKHEVERNLEMRDQTLLKLKLELKDLTFLKENYEEYQQGIKKYQHKLCTYSKIEKENSQLKEELKKLKYAVDNKLLLEEQVHDLRKRLITYKEKEKQLADLQAAQVEKDLYLNEWHAVARGICESTGSDSSLPHKLRTTVEHLQQKEINLTSDKVQLESQLNSALHDSKVAGGELEKTLKHVRELQSNVHHRQNLIHRMQKKLLLVSRERDSYRLQLDSYERDLSMCVNLGNNSQISTQQTQRERIENLERIVEGYREMVTKLENDLQNFEPSITEDVPIRKEQVTRLQEELSRLKIDNQQLREQRDKLEIKLEELLVGSDTNSERIVHLIKNPLKERIEEHDKTVEKLQEEVFRLKRKIRNMEEGLDGSALNDISMNPADLNALKEQLKSSENQIQRLKEYFKSSMQEFRNVIYMLLGYKIDKSSNSQYKLTSMYAEHQEDQICFQLDPEGALSLLENEFSSTLEDMVDLHLRHQKSIPVFLSAITMDMFQNHTMTSKTFEIDDN